MAKVYSEMCETYSVMFSFCVTLCHWQELQESCTPRASFEGEGVMSSQFRITMDSEGVVVEQEHGNGYLYHLLGSTTQPSF